MVFKEIENKDLPKLNDLYTQLCGYPSDFDQMCKVWEKEKDNDSYKIFGVFEGDELVGTSTVSRCIDLTGTCQYYYSMENFVIDETKRGCGYGSFLIKEVEKYVVSQNASYMSFTSSNVRTEAHKFYEKNGFAIDYIKGFKKVFE